MSGKIKILRVPGGDILAERSGKLWYARYMDTMIVMPTIKELKKAITGISTRLQLKYN